MHPAGEIDWTGTSDGAAAVAARARMSIEDRLSWMDEAVELAHETGSLAATRARRQAEVDAWWAGSAASS